MQGGYAMGIKKRAGILLIVSGMLLISWTIYIRLDTYHKQNVMIKEFNKAVEDINSQDIAARSGNTSNSSVSNNPTDVKGMIGILSIPKIDLKVAVVNGVDAHSLKIALGHFKETPMPGQNGNCAISGHRSYTYNHFFNRLDEVQIGDEIDVTALSGNYKYLVYEKKITTPNDVSVLNNTSEPVITLITCHPPHSSKFRLIVRGRLQP